MAQEHGMIEPFEPGQVRAGRRPARSSRYGTSSYGYDMRCARRIQDLHQHQLDHRRSEELRREELRRLQRRRLHHSAEFVRAGAHGRVLPHSAQRADDLPGQEHLCALRHHRQRDAARAGVGRPRDAGVLQHHAAAGEDLRQRRRGADAVLRVATRSARPRTRIAAASTRASAA